MKVRLNEVDFSRFNDENSFGNRWVDEYPDLPDAIDNYFNKSRYGFPEPGDIEEWGRGYFATVDGREFYFQREEDVYQSMFDSFFCEGWEPFFHDDKRNIEIIQSRYPGMYPTDHMRETITECLEEIVEEEYGEEIDDIGEYVYDKYMDTGNGLTCSDEAIDILTSEEHYNNFMDRLLFDEDTFRYFMDEYDYFNDYRLEMSGYCYVDDGWYVEEY